MFAACEKTFASLLLCLYVSLQTFAQDNMSSQDNTSTVDKVLDFPNRFFTKVHNSTTDLDNQIKKQAMKCLERMAKEEKKLEQELFKTDSTTAKSLFSGAQQKYQQLETELNTAANPNIANPLRQYIPTVDSMQTAFRFMNVSALNVPNFPVGKLQQIQQLSQEMQQLQARLQSANDIQQYIGQREQQLKNQLLQLGFAKDYSYINQQTYYYQQQVSQYRAMLSDPKQIEEKLLTASFQLKVYQ